MDTSNETRTFAYRPRWRAIVYGGSLFAAAGVFFGYIASATERGLILNGMIEFSPEGAKVLYWILCGLSAVFVAMSALQVFTRLTIKQEIVLASSSITVPRSRWSSEHLEIRFEDIEDIQLFEAYGQRVVCLRHRGGKASIVASMLPAQDDFNEIIGVLTGTPVTE